MGWMVLIDWLLCGGVGGIGKVNWCHLDWEEWVTLGYLRVQYFRSITECVHF